MKGGRYFLSSFNTGEKHSRRKAELLYAKSARAHAGLSCKDGVIRMRRRQREVAALFKPRFFRADRKASRHPPVFLLADDSRLHVAPGDGCTVGRLDP